MEVVNQRSALLSNYEVLTLLKELESDHLAKTRTALRIKKEEEAAGLPRNHAPQEEVLENLRTIEVEAIQYLTADYQPTSKQTEGSITQLTKNMAAYKLTKAEKLQIVNLAPVEPVELYVIVEELEDRLGDRMQDILDTVQASLSEPTAPAPAPSAAIAEQAPVQPDVDMHIHAEPAPVQAGVVEVSMEEVEEWHYEEQFVHEEGMRIEGDLEAEGDED